MGSILKQHFEKNNSEEFARRLFLEVVSTISVETSSYCNRRCPYCPNSIVDRISENKKMPIDLIEKIAKDLGSANWKGQISLHQFNEPLADDRIVEIVAIFRRWNQNATIGFSTNGDFLQRDILDALSKAGVSYLHISPHTAPTKAYDPAEALKRLSEVAKRIECTVTMAMTPTGYIEAKWQYPGVQIYSKHHDYSTSGSDRAGSLSIGEKKQRHDPCVDPMVEFFVSYTGDIFSCCHMNVDVADHKKYSCGNINDFESIFQAYANSSLVDWRRDLIKSGPKKSPCDTCQWQSSYKIGGNGVCEKIVSSFSL